MIEPVGNHKMKMQTINPNKIIACILYFRKFT